MRFLKTLAFALLLVGQAHTLFAHEMHEEMHGQQSPMRPKAEWTHSMRPLTQYGLTIPDFDPSRFEVLCREHEKITPRNSASPVCNAHDTKKVYDAIGEMNVQIAVENRACYMLDAGAPNLCEAQAELSVWTARYAPDDTSWQVENTTFFLARLMHLAEGAFIGKHLHAQGKNFVAHSVRLPTSCAVPNATVVHYDVVTTGTVNGNTVSHTIHTLQGFFAMEVPYIVEINRRSTEIIRELYFSIRVFNGGVSQELGSEACDIIKSLASQARRN